MQPLIRGRRTEDIGHLIEVMAEQQPASLYPFVWPLPFPAETFIARDHELTTFVGELDGRVVGHLSVQSIEGAEADIGSDELAVIWSAAHGCPPEELAIISCFFTATETRGTGLGTRLHDTAVGWIRDHGLRPCLDVVQTPNAPIPYYRARGWQHAGELYPPWLPEGWPPVLAMVLP